MGVLADLPRQRPPIGLGHPVLGFDELIRRDARLERFEELRVLEILDLRGLLQLGRIHGHDVALAAARFKSGGCRTNPKCARLFRRPHNQGRYRGD
jgi:hypothetical protein